MAPYPYSKPFFKGRNMIIVTVLLAAIAAFFDPMRLTTDTAWIGRLNTCAATP